LVTNVVTNLVVVRTALHSEFFARPVLQDGLTAFICALIFLTPLFVLRNYREKYQFLAILARDFQNVNKLLKDVRRGPNSELAWTLKRAILFPFFDTPFAEVFAAVVTFHGVTQNF
jgi:hypothetical protein